ncbi:hypothetical protein MUG10_14560 [Xanthomonas prunicola]|uniref:Uncharacterized protein n=1 Tax=Xanthomonas prunicola TaxID=2053930 RepID=A0A9Q9J1G9_9XANT|nr:hypothetical protein [Xanthomonas prunicola]USI99297.1 hypothetical protein MUG10_14560 [Xanthomonas prunicola]UXA56181.1 hypothetical protein M0D47_15350 [Xanthomonas prunicola]UXA64353.1 hypothetical protein M0D43_15520 [Xanthomonas prunicola]UXA67928.1 hypothetical protein M0D46_12340 [Xanthomonas prunicola]
MLYFLMRILIGAPAEWQMIVGIAGPRGNKPSRQVMIAAVIGCAFSPCIQSGFELSRHLFLFFAGCVGLRVYLAVALWGRDTLHSGSSCDAAR